MPILFFICKSNQSIASNATRAIDIHAVTTPGLGLGTAKLVGAEVPVGTLALVPATAEAVAPAMLVLVAAVVVITVLVLELKIPADPAAAVTDSEPLKGNELRRREPRPRRQVAS